MLAENFITENPDFLKGLPKESHHWERVKQDAHPHTSYKKDNKNIVKARPREDENITQYRKDNQRNITRGVVRDFLDEINRILSGSHIDNDSLSDEMLVFLKKKPFKVGHERNEFWSYFFDFILNVAVQDVNSLWIPFVPGAQDNSIAPRLLPSNILPDPVSLVIPSCHIIEKDKILCWYTGEVEFKEDKKPVSKPAYFISDEFWYYRYTPRQRRTAENKYEYYYTLDQWFFHNIGEIPYNTLPGIQVRDEDNPNLYFKETIIDNFIPLADQFQVMDSDSHGVWINHTSPKLMLPEIPCMNPDCGTHGGKKGYIKKKTKKAYSAEYEYEKCSFCNTKGMMAAAGPYDTLVFPRPEADTMNGVSSSGLSKAEYLRTPTDSVNLVFDEKWKMLDRAITSLGMAVIGKEQESGVARELRFMKLKAKFNKFTNSASSSVSNFFRYLDCILNYNVANRREPAIYFQQEFQFKNLSQAREDFLAATGPEKIQAAIDIFKIKYRSRPKKIRAAEIAYNYCPLLSIERGDLVESVGLGTYGNDAIFKYDHLLPSFLEVAKLENFMELSDEDIVKLAEAELDKYRKRKTEQQRFDINNLPGDVGGGNS